MEDKIDYAKCMTRKCEECKRYNYCFAYRRKTDKNQSKKH